MIQAISHSRYGWTWVYCTAVAAAGLGAAVVQAVIR